MSRKTWAGFLALLLGSFVSAHAESNAVLRIETSPTNAAITWLSWDTEGGPRAKLNLLRPGTAAGISVKLDKQWRPAVTFPTTTSSQSPTGMLYQVTIAPDAELSWSILPGAGRLEMTFAAKGAGWSRVQGLYLNFPFAPTTAATTVFPALWDAAGGLHLPAVISAPDFGQMLVSASNAVPVQGWLEGNRARHLVDLNLELPVLKDGGSLTLFWEPVRLPTPAGLSNPVLWQSIRRGWWNALEPSSHWGDTNKPSSAPAGIFANNVISDPVSSGTHMYADHIFLTPAFSADIHLTDLLRRTLDWWFDHGVKTNGEIYAYMHYAEMLDANASPLIAAWDYVETTGDHAWLTRRIERLELIANFVIQRDIDDDGLIESIHSGNYGTLIEPMRAGSTYDTINSGGKDAYCNALIYRAFRCLADLEKQLGRTESAALYTSRANRLKAAFQKTFYNPKTGWLAWWKSTDGELHDLSSPVITSLAVCYGLIDPAEGRAMIDRLWTRMEAAGFHRFDLGVPVTFVPIRKGDYILGIKGNGVPSKEDGSDTFSHYLNGGCLVGDAYDFIIAQYIVGQPERGDRILQAMFERQSRGVFPNGGGFQNGVINRDPLGAEFYTWDGKTCGYEGHLTFTYSFLQTLFLREPAWRARLFRPLQP